MASGGAGGTDREAEPRRGRGARAALSLQRRAVGPGLEPEGGAGAAPSNRVTAWRFSPGDSAPIMRYEVTCARARARVLSPRRGGAAIESTASPALTHQGMRATWHEAQAVASTPHSTA
jgi:hypothetical protein